MLTDEYSVSGELSEQDFAAIAELGVTLIINARPDDETEGQKNDREFKTLCEQHGIDYVHVPVKPGQYSESDIKTVAIALNETEGKAHGFCRTGARAAHLWALSQKEQKSFEELQKKAQANGFDLAIVESHF